MTALKVIDDKYRAGRSAVLDFLKEHAEAQQQLDRQLYTEQTQQTTVLALKAALERYSVDTSKLLDAYVSNVKRYLKIS